MVRSLCVAAVSFVLIGVLYFFCDGASRKASVQLVQNSRQAALLEQQGHRQQALMHLQSMEEQWAKQTDFFSFFIDHQRLDRIGEEMQWARMALENGRMFDFFHRLAVLESAAEMLHEAEALLLKNIW